MLAKTSFLDNYRLEGKQLEILTYPDPKLAKKATPVTIFNEELENLCKDMLYTMYKAPGIGLAAPQVGLSSRFFVLDIDYERHELTKADGSEDLEYSNFSPKVFINPVIRAADGETTFQEGCLSVPGIYEDVKRKQKITLDYFDLTGTPRVLEADGLLAICIQHEIDHLDGIVFIERLSGLKRSFYKKKMQKEKRKTK